MGEEEKPTKAKVLPTVGRMVYFKTRGSADGVYLPTQFAAIITEVQPDNSTCHLVVFGPDGLRFEHFVPNQDAVGCWDWMPFQKDQAARLAAGTAIAQPGGAPDKVA